MSSTPNKKEKSQGLGGCDEQFPDVAGNNGQARAIRWRRVGRPRALLLAPPNGLNRTFAMPELDTGQTLILTGQEAQLDVKRAVRAASP